MMSDIIEFLSINLIPCFHVREKWTKNILLLRKNENCPGNCGNLHLFFFSCWCALPSNTLNCERPPEIDANPELYSILWKKSNPSHGLSYHRKRSEKGLFSSCLLAQQRWWHMWIKFIITKTCLFKYTENFPTKKWKFSDKNSDIVSYFCWKHRLLVLVRTALPRRF